MTTALSSARPLQAAPNLRPVDPSAGRRSKTRFFVILAVIGVFGTLLAAAALQSMVVSGQHRIDEINKSITEEEQELQNERVRLAAEQSPDRLRERAVALGLAPVPDQRVISAERPSEAQVPSTDESQTDPDTSTRSSELASATSGAANQ